MTTFISDQEHYEIVLEKMLKAQRLLWIGTADIKDLYVKKGNDSQPLLGALSDLLKKGVEVRLIHAKEPGPNFREDFDKYPILAHQLERVLCNRVHFKIIVIDCEWVYIGSANLTGAGMGMKSSHKRNFEAGIFSDEPHLVDGAMEEFDRIWRGDECKKCGLQMFGALQYHNVPSRIVVFHAENHELSRGGRPLNRIKRLYEITSWMEKYLQKTP